MLRLGYNTNGMAHHRLEDALGLLADLGYRGVALTLDVGHFNPYSPNLSAEVERVGRIAQERQLGLVVETGARFLLDAKHKHQPTLISEEPAGRARRLDFLCRAMSIARDLGAEALSIWSGTPEPQTSELDAWSRLADGVAALLSRSERVGVTVAFEPEPGMFIGAMDDFRRLRGLVGEALKLTLDLGHCFLTEPEAPEEVIRSVAPWIANVHAEDMRRPAHAHLPFGQGEMCYPPILRALEDIDYRGLINVELSRESHWAAEAARQAIQYLTAAQGARPAAEIGERP